MAGLKEHKYPSRVMNILRQRRGLEEHDESLDANLTTCSPREAFAEVCGWKFGDPGWGDVLIDWLEDCGFDVAESDE